MKKQSLTKSLGLALAVIAPAFSIADGQETPFDGSAKTQLLRQVRAELLHAWQGYKTYAWGHDELHPVSKQAVDWYGQSLYITPIDSLDTLILTGLRDEANEDRNLIDSNVSFDKDISVQVFEINIRLLGGLLSSYELTGDKKLLQLAEDLGNRLLPAFNSPTGMPYRFVNLRTGAVTGADTNPAEVGTVTLELGTLSKLTGRSIYYDKAKAAVVALYNRRSSTTGLVGSGINVETGAWTSTDSSISGGIDSYIEYLWKAYLLFGDKDFFNMWQTTIAAVNQYLPDIVRNGELWYGHADMNSGQRTATVYGALDAFFPGLLVLSGDFGRSIRLQESSFKMWNLYGIEPELLDYSNLTVVSPPYILRPEIVESAFYLHYFTGQSRYVSMGQTFFDALVKYCRVDAGYTRLNNVTTKEKDTSKTASC
jgi:mannosidase alpha-like ER degradation enhancer 2